MKIQLPNFEKKIKALELGLVTEAPNVTQQGQEPMMGPWQGTVFSTQLSPVSSTYNMKEERKLV